MIQLTLWDMMNMSDPIDDEIDRCIRIGTGFVNGKIRVMDIMSRDIPTKEKASLVAKEYGVGGRTIEHGFFSSDSKGMRWQLDDGTDITLNWLQVVNRIEKMIRSEDY